MTKHAKVQLIPRPQINHRVYYLWSAASWSRGHYLQPRHRWWQLIKWACRHTEPGAFLLFSSSCLTAQEPWQPRQAAAEWRTDRWASCGTGCWLPGASPNLTFISRMSVHQPPARESGCILPLWTFVQNTYEIGKFYHFRQKLWGLI